MDISPNRSNNDASIATASVPLVSILIPAYNCEAYIGSAIESALNQEGVSLEVIVVDDASNDRTAKIASSYAEHAPVRVFVNEINRGVSHSRNRAIREARGEWLALLDADDWFAPRRLAVLLDAAKSHDADMVSDDVYLVHDATHLAYTTRLVDNNALIKEAKWISPVDLVRFDLGSIKPLMRRSFVICNDLFYSEEVRYGEDFLQLLLALVAGGRMLIIPTPMYHLRRGDTGSLTTNKARLYAQVLATTQQLLEDPVIRDNQPLLVALRRRQNQVKQFAILQDIVGTFKAGHIGSALFRLLIRPSLFPTAVKRGLMVLGVRIRRLRHRDLLAGASRPQSAASYPNTPN